MTETLNNGERQVAPTLDGIRRDHRARYEWVARNLPPASRVIDLACGVGYGAFILAEAGHTVVAVDRSAEAIAYAEEHYAHPAVHFLIGDASDPHIIRHSVNCDAAVTFETIEHLANPVPMLRTLQRSAPVLYASVPNEEKFPFRCAENDHRGWLHHHRHYTKAEFAALLGEAGWGALGWFGQVGRESVVAADVNGRTLVVIAERSDPIKVASPMPSVAVTKPDVPAHVAIVGLGPSGMQFFELIRGLGGASAYCDEVWGINAIGDTFRCDRIFHMDDVLVQEVRAAAKPEGNIAAMVRWLKTHPGPIYTSIARPGYPGLVPFPLQDVLNRKLDANGGAPYFNSTAAYAIALAVHIGVKQISLFGLDFTYPNRHHAERGRACCEFWLGIAAARGIEITVPDRTSLLDACEPEASRLYGYDGVEVYLHNQPDGTVQVEMVPRAELPTAEEVERAYDHSKHPNPLMRET